MKQREIKFRAWDGKEMHQKVCINHEGKAVKYGYRATDWVDDANAGTPMQYTGILDKNGKEIYEGDIVQWTIYDDYNGTEHINKGSVYYHEKEARCRIRQFPEFEVWRFGDEIEVIGNIYEQPNLIKND